MRRAGIADAQRDDDEHARHGAEDVDVDGRHQPEREDDRAGHAAEHREQEPEDEDQRLGDEEQLDVDPELGDELRERLPEDSASRNCAWNRGQPGRVDDD